MSQPKNFGKYKLIAHLATGGMAEIYLASVSGLGGFEKMVVIKRILPNLAREKRFVEMFLDEARIAARLNHPNVVQIFDLGQVEGQFFIAMEYLSGESLSMVVKACRKAQQPFPVELSAGIVMQAAEGLHHAHTMCGDDGRPFGIVHRDVSPQNIFVLYDGGVKVVDFGIAKAAIRSTQTRTGALKGKFAYMSPEQILTRDLDCRSDVFSLGIVLWECLVGRKLYRQESDLTRLQAIVYKDAPSPRSFNPAVPPEVERIVGRALARDREQRYQSAADFRADLYQFLKQASVESDTMAVGRFMEGLFRDRIAKKRKMIETAKDNWISDTSVDDVRIYSSDTEQSIPNTTPTSRRSLDLLVARFSWLRVGLLLIFGLGALGIGYALTSAPEGRDQGPVSSIIADPAVDTPPPLAVRSNETADPRLFVPTTAEPADPKTSAPNTADKGTASLKSSEVDTVGTGTANPKTANDAGRALNEHLSKGEGKQVAAAAVESKHAQRRKRREAKPAREVELPAPADQPPGMLRLTTDPWTDVYFRGRKLGQTPLIDVELPAGRVRLRVVNREAGIDSEITVQIEPGKRVVQRFNLF